MDATQPILRIRTVFVARIRGLRPIGRCCCVAIAITLLQIAVACVASGQSQPILAWRSLYQWDGGWYAHITDHGYRLPSELAPGRYCSVGFFPGYPLLGRFAQSALGIDTRAALLVVSQASCAVFWLYTLLLLRRWQVSRPLSAIAILFIAVHPGAFFLVASYSESLFLALLAGYLYWSQRPGPASWWLAALHGFTMTGTRLVGVPLALLPLVQTWFLPNPIGASGVRRFIAPSLLAIIAGAGAALFFAYLHWRFGRWDLYLAAQRTCWGVAPDYFAFLHGKTYGLPYLAVQRLFTDVAHTNRMMAPMTLAGFVILLIGECRSRFRNWHERLPLYISALLLFFIPACSYASLQMLGMIRYGACVHVFLVLILVHQMRQCATTSAYRFALMSLPAVLLSLAIQLVLIWRFTHGQVVA